MRRHPRKTWRTPKLHSHQASAGDAANAGGFVLAHTSSEDAEDAEAFFFGRNRWADACKPQEQQWQLLEPFIARIAYHFADEIAAIKHSVGTNGLNDGSHDPPEGKRESASEPPTLKANDKSDTMTSDLIFYSRGSVLFK